MNSLVEIQGNQVVVASRKVAEHFEKLHKHVLDSIREILSAENSADKFSSKHRSREENAILRSPL